MATYIIRKGSQTLTTSANGYIWAPRTLATPIRVDRDTADELADLYGGAAEEDA